jgi:multiple sugar transport system permease protein
VAVGDRRSGVVPDASSATANKRRRASKRRARADAIFSLLLAAPYIALLAVFGVFPVFYALGLSFMDTIDYVFWGLTNYRAALADFRLTASILNVLTFVAIWIALTVVGVIVLSLMLDAIKGRRAATVLRTIYFLPGAVTSSAIVVLWLFLLDPLVSPFRIIAPLAGWETRQEVINGIGFAGIFALMAFFTGAGGWIVVMGGALTSIPDEVVEAARADGAKGLQLALRIKLPLIRRAVALMAILSFGSGLQIFVEPQLMALAGHSFSRLDWSINQLAFQYAFALGDFGISAALSTMLLAVSIGVALLIIFVTKFYRTD